LTLLESSSTFAAQNLSAADRIARTIYDSVTSLESFPQRGRLGRIDGTRELVLTPLPFIVVYRIKQNIVEAVRVLHGSQQWP